MGLLDLSFVFDWVDHLDGMLRLFTNVERGTHHNRAIKRGTVAISVPRAEGKSGAEIEAYLAKHGVKIYGRLLSDKAIHFTVGNQQADWARRLVNEVGSAGGARAWSDWTPEERKHTQRKKHERLRT